MAQDCDEEDCVYHIMKYWHPDAGKSSEFVEEVETKGEAQAICSGPESSFRLGNTTNHYFLGYTSVSK